MIRLISFFLILFGLYGFSADPFKGMSEEEKIKSYEKIKIEILQRWTCNYFSEEVNDYMLDKSKKTLELLKNIFMTIHFIFTVQEMIKKS